MTSTALPMNPTILFVGDLHVGRRPEVLASLLADMEVSTRALSPAAAWMETVEHAIDIGAVAVVLAGDVIDREEDLLEAYNVVEEGAKALQRANIPLIAVAGNHDAKLLPRLVDNVESVQLLGAGGIWESTALEVDDQRVELIGWSFPSAHYERNPLQDPALRTLTEGARPSNVRRILVVHGDLDVPTSLYAPMTRSELENLNVDAAFLGHIHKPDPLNESRPIGYLGSLVGLDAGETGEHGPVEVHLTPSGTVVATRIAMAPVRWEAIDVDVTSDLPWNAERLKRQVNSCVSEWLATHRVHLSTKVLALRVRFVGRREIDGWSHAVHALETEETRSIFADNSQCTIVVERYVDDTKLTLDLDIVARENTPAGRLARFLQQPVESSMRQNARRVLESSWSGEDLHFPEEFDVDSALKVAAQRTLERMLDARASRGPS